MIFCYLYKTRLRRRFINAWVDAFGISNNRNFKLKMFFTIMPFVYHIVHEKMHGKMLYSLNSLKRKYPQAYKEEIKKYKGRKEVMKRKIPHLNCYWNDAIHVYSAYSYKRAIRCFKYRKGFGLNLIISL